MQTVEEGVVHRRQQTAEDRAALRPVQQAARRHQDRQITGAEAVPGHGGKADHQRGVLAAQALGLVEQQLHFAGFIHEIQPAHGGPAVELRLVEHLRTGVEPGFIAQPQRVAGREQPELRMRLDHPVLVGQGQAAVGLQQALDDEQHVRAPGVVLVEQQRHGLLHGPGQNAFLKGRNLLAVLHHDGVLADQVQPRDVAVEVDPHQRPAQPAGDLLDVAGLARAVQPLDQHPVVEAEPGEDGAGGLRLEAKGRVERRDMRAVDCQRLGHPVQIETKISAAHASAILKLPFTTSTGTGSSQQFSAAPLTPKPSSIRNSAKCAEQRIRLPSGLRNSPSRTLSIDE